MDSEPKSNMPEKNPSDGSFGKLSNTSNPAMKSPTSTEKLSKSPSSDDHSAASKRAQFGRQSSVSSPSSKGRLDRNASRDSLMRRRRSSYRRGSSFDLPHTNSMPMVPVDLKGLQAIDKSQVPWWTSQRFLLSIICFFGFGLLYAQRVNLSIAIVSMVDHKHVAEMAANASGLAITTTTLAPKAYNSSSNSTVVTDLSGKTKGEEDLCPELMKNATSDGEFHWDKPLQGLILGAFFWGYLILQVIGGMVSERFGAKRVITLGMLPVAILTILSPVCARANPYLFLVVRVLIGVGEGVMYPAAQALWSRWAPPNERSRLIGFSYAGGQFGNAMIFPIGGFLCAYGFDGGWPSVFYVIGACGFLWCIVWIIFATDSPDQNKRVSDIEKKYIQLSLGDRAKRGKGVSTPWRAIFTSRGMWAIIIAHMCGNYGAYMLLTQIPTYMKEVLKFDIKSNGVFSMLPYLVFWFFITVSGMLADFLISREILSVAWTRKLMAGIGMIGPGSFLIGTGFMQCHQQMEAVAMLTISVGLCGFHFSGYFINHGDIAPAFAGTLFGISNTAATVPGILAPYVVAALTPNGSQEEWQTAFYVAAAIYFCGAACYVLLGQGEVQPWSEFEEPDDIKDQDDEEAGTGFGLHELQQVHEEEEEDEEEEKAAEKMLNQVNGDTANAEKV